MFYVTSQFVFEIKKLEKEAWSKFERVFFIVERQLTATNGRVDLLLGEWNDCRKEKAAQRRRGE